MKLEKIITLANGPVRLRFLAMERSLRATGCDLPLLVIPFDERRFELPPNATWWTTGIREWLQHEHAHPLMFKHQCMTTANYQFVDSDIIFLRNPAKVLADQEGFITSCGHWHGDFEHTVTPESLAILEAKSTCWQRNVFNSGQYACDRVLYTEAELKRTCLDPRHISTCLRHQWDQPGIVLLANLAGVPIRNLTLPPTCMESTWAGDYIDRFYKDYWRDEAREPYLMHWAGCDMWMPRTVDPLFTQYLSATELAAWNEEVAANQSRELRDRRSARELIRGFARGTKSLGRPFKK
jgi:hypothetical protein